MLIFLIIGTFGHSVSQSTHFRLFTMREGLSQMKITALHIDRRGYLWIGTRNGLNKFDGEKFVVYNETHGLPHNRIHSIEEDTSGNIVLLTYNGVSIFDGERFTLYPKPFTSVLFDLAVDKDNTIWVCERYVNPALYKIKNGKYETVVDKKGILHFQCDKRNDEKFLTAEGTVYKIVKDSLQFVDKGGYFFYPTSRDVFDIPYFVKASTVTPKMQVLSYYIDGKLTPVATINDIDAKPIIYDLYQNTIWASVRGQLDLPDNGNGRTLFEHEFPITNDVVKDQYNQYWIGSENGLGQIYNDAFRTLPMHEISNAWTVIEDNSKNIWFGTYGNGMFIKHAGSADVSKAHMTKTLHYFAGSAIDKDGTLYFATNVGLEIIEHDKSRLVWGNNTVFAVHYDVSADHVVFGTYEGVGILYKNDSIQYYGPQEGLHENHYIQSIGQDSLGNYWLGSYSGLSKLNPCTGKIANYTIQNGKLPCQGVYCSLMDSQGRFWLGGDHGLLYYDYAIDSIVHIRSEVLQSMVKSMIELEDKRLLVATKDGLYIFDKERFLMNDILDFQIFNASNGYTGIDPGFTGMYKDSDGDIWICSALSVDRLNPNKLKNTRQQIKAVITHVNNRSLPFKHQVQVIDMPRGESNLVIRFEATGFSRPLHTEYQYRLNGGTWSAWSVESEVVLRNLESGAYRFEVRAGPFDYPTELEDIDHVNFTIHLPFYKSKWFPPIAFTLLALFLLLSARYYWIQKNAQRKYKAQLGEARYLRSQLLLSQLNPHFIFNVLANIQNNILFDKKEEASKGIVNLSKLLRNFLNASYKGNSLNSTHSESEILLSTEIELLESYMEFEQSKNDHHFDYFVEYPENFNPENYTIPPMLIQPFVENAIKHGLLLQKKRGNLWLKFKEENGQLICSIEDDGVGIEEAMQLQKQTFVTHTSLGSKIVKERVDLLNELGYHIEINTRSRIPKGTIVELIFKD